MSKERSVGVTIASVFYMLFGLLFLLPMPLFSLLYLLTGIGLFLLKAPARYLAITTSALGIVVNTTKIPELLKGTLQKEYGPDAIFAVGITYLFHLGMIYFLTRPLIKAQFQRE